MDARRTGVVASLAAGLAALVLACNSGGSGGAAPPPSVARGEAVFAQYCALCHGSKGEGYAADQATAVANPEFLRIATDEFLTAAVTRGRPSTTMSAWGTAYGGPLSAEDVSAVVMLLRSWQTAPSVTPTPPSVPGDVTRGATLFAGSCAKCHGATGIEGPYVQLANPGLLASADDAFLAYSVTHGRPATQMLPSALAAQDLADVVALVRSWQKPLPPGDVELPGSFGPIVQNPTGAEPAFTPGQRYTSADLVHAELAAGKKMVLLDARAPSSYAEGHVKNAIDLPFYEVKSYADMLPRDAWIVCYCACPHAESGAAMDALVSLGFTKVTVIDEGFYVWQSKGYETSKGNLP